MYYYKTGNNDIMSKKEKKFFRDCPRCSKKVGHVKAAGRDAAVKLNTVCKSCSQKGKVRSAEHKAKLSALYKGVKLSAEARAKMSAAHKGVKLSPKHKANISASNQKKRDEWTKLYGEKIEYPNGHFAYWGIDVKDRDNWTCKRCNTVATGHYINAHHIIPCGYFTETALDLNNGATLCKSCHKQIHNDLDRITLTGIKLTQVGFQDHAAKFIAEGQASSQSTQNPTEYKPVFEPMITSHKE